MTQSEETIFSRISKKSWTAIAVLAILMTCMIAVGYSHFASLQTSDNAIDGEYVTLTLTTSADQPVPDGVLFTYTQKYNTYTDYANNTVYRMLTDTTSVKLNPQAYKLTVYDGEDTPGTYTLKAKMPVPALYEDSAMTKNCRFTIVLTNATETYTATLSGSSFATFLDSGSQTAAVAAGVYTMNIYLTMCTSPTGYAGDDPSIGVDKAKFVDRFSSTEMAITLKAEA